MQTAQVARELIIEGEMDSASFGFAHGQEAHIMGILRSSLYTRKALAVLREYSSNGWDAHRMAGHPDKRIKITLPTFGRPTYHCRDFGPGLSRQEVLHVYTQYGASTKRETNDAVGALGIGSKSAFCLGDSFTITSWHGGEKSVYLAVLDSSNKGKMTLLHSEGCEDETGIEIKIAVPSRMIPEFRSEARHLFRYMRPQPIINQVTLEPLPIGLDKGFIHVASKDGWLGIMGCVPYRIDINRFQEPLTEAGIWTLIQKLSGGIYIPIGDVDFGASREELQYTDKTITVLVDAFGALIKDYLEDALSTLKSGDGTGWERRHKAVFLSKGLGFPLPKKFSFLGQGTAHLWNKEKEKGPKQFSLLSNTKKTTTSIPVASNTCILIQEDTDTQSMAGYQLQIRDVVIVPKGGYTTKEARALLDDMLIRAHLDGVPIGQLSERDWYAPTSSTRCAVNAKHRQHTFTLTSQYMRGLLSENWDKALSIPEDGHVYVILNRFKVEGPPDFYEKVRSDKNIAREFGLTFPKNIYGYKSTKRRPITPEDIENGTPYDVWRKAFFSVLMTPKRRTEIQNMAWASLFHRMPYKFTQYSRPEDGGNQNFKRRLPQTTKELSAGLGEKHIVVRYFKSYLHGVGRVSKMTQTDQRYLSILSKMFPSRSAPERALDRIQRAYPMLALILTNDKDMHVFQTHMDTLVTYILSIDGTQK